MDENEKPGKLTKKKAKAALRAARRKEIAAAQSKKYKSATVNTVKANTAAKETASTYTQAAQEKYKKAYSDGTKPPREAEDRNMRYRTMSYTERMDTGATPETSTKKQMKTAMRNVKSRRRQMSPQAYKANKKLY